MKTLSLLALGALLTLASPLTSATPTQPSRLGFTHSSSYWLSSYSQALSQAQQAGKPVLILFTGTTWCPACMKLEQDVLNSSQFYQPISQKFILLKAEFPEFGEDAVKRSPYKELLDKYNVTLFPTMVIVNANGQQLFTVSYQPGGPQVYVNELTSKLNQAGFR